ncbi:uncharacterized protein N7515_001228 [Penicillium bovifimosum]|uniref:Zn(2)-C6 fungal-type domain-containing protein n=1 Tax=Penicillium bovifimosum TaxID=126998 RepID=A0A9W9L860_9EURO|nr:uncharacterized protein N7515_001228 [Penicillium bovifimosum]KAJ5142441.1 hypothetical protein N7515_001228 [Penicillium bovifimosum]
MHPTHNYRHSRRSACDRCRGQKLRCERDHLNGMSCERCLKAQEICITSLNQSGPVILPSHHGQGLIPRDREDHRFAHSEPMSVLHKSSGHRVKKQMHPSSPVGGRSSSKNHYHWRGLTSLPFLPEDNVVSSPSEFDLNIPMEFGTISVPFEQWSDQYLPWPANDYHLPPEYVPSDPMYSDGGRSCFPSVCDSDTSNAQAGSNQRTEMAVLEPFLGQPSSHGIDSPSMFASNSLPEPGWGNMTGFATLNESYPLPIVQMTTPSMQGLHKSLLKLRMGLLEDLDLLETGSTGPGSSLFMHDIPAMSVETLNLPICRLLDHSSWLLGIIQSLFGPSEDSFSPTPSPQLSDPQLLKWEGSEFGPLESGDNGDEAGTTISPHDSGYHTATTSPGQPTSPSIPKCDITLWLGILEAHCTLTRVYRAVFTRLYQLFLIIPPTDAATILLLPSERLGQSQLEGELLTQVQSLIASSSTIIGKLDRALGIRSKPTQAEEDEGPAYEKDWSTSIRDIVLAQEQSLSEISLMEIMECLRQLVKDPVSI